MKAFRACVDFESDTAPLRSYRGTVFAEKAQTAVHRAVVAASRAHPGCRWRSLVVLLERLEPETQDVDVDEGVDEGVDVDKDVAG